MGAFSFYSVPFFVRVGEGWQLNPVDGLGWAHLVRLRNDPVVLMLPFFGKLLLLQVGVSLLRHLSDNFINLFLN